MFPNCFILSLWETKIVLYSKEKWSHEAWVLWLIWSELEIGFPNSSWPYSSCRLSCLFQMYLITRTVHRKLSVVSFVVNHRVLLSACCFVSKVCFLAAQHNWTLYSLLSRFAYSLMSGSYFIPAVERTGSAGVPLQFGGTQGKLISCIENVTRN